MEQITTSLLTLTMLLTAACAHAPAPSTASPKLRRETPTVQHTPSAERYLAAIEVQLDTPWNRGIRDVAAAALPSSHRLNDPRLSVTIEARLPAGETRAHLRVVRRSGWHPFDNSAMRLLSRMKWPAPPADLDGQQLTVRWQFFRDARGCSRQYASLVAAPLAPAQALALALSQQARQRALEITRRTPSSAALRLLVQRGLADQRLTVRALALRLADTGTIERALTDDTLPLLLWRAAVAEAHKRVARRSLLRAIERLSHPPYDWRPASPEERQRRDERLSELLLIAPELGLKISHPVVARALRSRRLETVRAALPFANDLAPLWAALQRLGTQYVPGTAAALARALAGRQGDARLRRRVLAELRRTLFGRQESERGEALDALARWPRPELGAALAELSRLPLPVASLAACLRARAALGGDPLFLYRAMHSSQSPLRLAAIEGLGRFPGAGLAASYRLGKQAYEAPEPFRSAAIAAMVRINHPRMEKDIAYLVRRLPGPSKRLLAKRLVALGTPARSVLALIARHTPAQLEKADQQRARAHSRSGDVERLVRALTAPSTAPAGSVIPVANR